MGLHPHTKFGLPTLSHYVNFPQKRFRLRRRTDDGRKVNVSPRVANIEKWLLVFYLRNTKMFSILTKFSVTHLQVFFLQNIEFFSILTTFSVTLFQWFSVLMQSNVIGYRWSVDIRNNKVKLNWIEFSVRETRSPNWPFSLSDLYNIYQGLIEKMVEYVSSRLSGSFSFPFAVGRQLATSRGKKWTLDPKYGVLSIPGRSSKFWKPKWFIFRIRTYKSVFERQKDFFPY